MTQPLRKFSSMQISVKNNEERHTLMLKGDYLLYAYYYLMSFKCCEFFELAAYIDKCAR